MVGYGPHGRAGLWTTVNCSECQGRGAVPPGALSQHLASEGRHNWVGPQAGFEVPWARADSQGPAACGPAWLRGAPASASRPAGFLFLPWFLEPDPGLGLWLRQPCLVSPLPSEVQHSKEGTRWFHAKKKDLTERQGLPGGDGPQRTGQSEAEGHHALEILAHVCSGPVVPWAGAVWAPRLPLSSAHCPSPQGLLWAWPAPWR